MNNHIDLSDREFELAFANCKLVPTLFNHEAHLRLAWIHITKYGAAQAEENIQMQLRRFAEFVGAPDKYHTTVTIVAVKAVDHFIRRSVSRTFRDFVQEFPQLKEDFKALVNSHYSFDIFQSEQAKTNYLAPDLVPFN